jgi:uncharacterized protein (TIGR03066 family)
MEMTMKHASRSARIKPAKMAPKNSHPQPQAGSANVSVKQNSSMPRWALIVVCVLLAGSATWAACEFVILTKLPSELVGKWVVVGGKQDGATFDFSRRGTMEAHLNNNGREDVLYATVAVEGDLLLVTTPHPQTKIENTKKIKIVELTEKRLILQDERGELWKMDRAN